MDEQESNKQEKVIENSKITRKFTYFRIATFILIISCFILFVISLFILHSQLASNQLIKNQQVITIISSTPQESTQPNEKVSEVTTDTKIATSLDAPQLNNDLQWTNITNQSKQNDINQASIGKTGKDSFDSFTFSKGNFWYTEKKGYDPRFLANYYQEVLEKQGWVGAPESLKFEEFTLSGLDADGPCGGVTGFVGYKDRMVRLVSIGYAISPCNPPSLSPTPANYSTKYTVFISDPIPLLEIIAKVKSH